jgi:hypothetical protein
MRPNFNRWSIKRLVRTASRLGVPGYEAMDRAELITWLCEAWG